MTENNDSRIEKLVDQLKQDNIDEIKSIHEKIDDLTNSLHTAKSHTHVHDENHNGNDSMKHEHAVHSWDKTCSDCGENNPDYSENQYKCVDCDKPMGTKTEASKSKACPHCSSVEGAYSEEEGYTI